MCITYKVVKPFSVVDLQKAGYHYKILGEVVEALAVCGEAIDKVFKTWEDISLYRELALHHPSLKEDGFIEEVKVQRVYGGTFLKAVSLSYPPVFYTLSYK